MFSKTGSALLTIALCATLAAGFVNDVGVLAIVEPTDRPYCFGDTIRPAARVTNYGTANQTNVPVRCRIRDRQSSVMVYDQVVMVDLAVDQTVDVVFPFYAPPQMEAICVDTMRTEQAGDQDPTNDWKAGEFEVVNAGTRHLSYNDGTFESYFSWPEEGGELAVRFYEPEPPLVVYKAVVWLTSFSGADYPAKVIVYRGDGIAGAPGDELGRWEGNLHTSIWTGLYKNVVYFEPAIKVDCRPFFVSYYQTSVSPSYPGLGMDYDEPAETGNDWGRYNGVWAVNGSDEEMDFGIEVYGIGSGSIAGTVFRDDNGDGVHDQGEHGLAGWTVRLEPGPRFALTDADGNYTFHYLLGGEYQVSEIPKLYWEQTLPPDPGIHDVWVSGGEEVAGKDFGSRVAVLVQDLAVSVAGGRARPGFEKTYAVRYENKGSVDAVATVTLALPSDVEYRASSPEGSYSELTHSVTWDVGSLPAPFEGYLYVTVGVPVIPIGTELTCSVTIEPVAGDADASDNYDTETEVVSGSFDPNMITVRPDPCIQAGDELDCTVYFQNTGNDTAFDIVVREVLDPGLDVSTVRPLAASRPCAFGFGAANEIVWSFNNIKLADSIANEPASHGFLRFRVRSRADLPVGTTINNTVAIYFDYNEPVLTNAVRLTVMVLGWSALAAMPLPPSNRQLDAGGWLACDPGGRIVYAAKGNKTSDFYRYDSAVDAWQARSSWPDGIERDKPSYGSAACAAGGVVYATKGNNTLGFWAYDAARDSWYQKASVPLGPDSLRVKGGTYLVWAGDPATGHAYLLKGGKNEFYRYHADLNQWEALAFAPGGVNRKWDRGSWLAFDGVNTIYAHRAEYNELYAYDISANAWSGPLAGMPFIGRSGRSEKSGNGGCGVYLGGSIYALKGGKTQEFWKYSIAANSWSEEDSMPRGFGGKTVGPGADVVAAGGRLYMTRGNECNDFWQYLPASFITGARSPEGAQARATSVIQGMAVGPNPAATGFAVLRYGLPAAGTAELDVYNVAGQRVLAMNLAAGQSGVVRLDLRQLNNGVYVARLSSPGFEASQKLVIQRQASSE